WYVRTSMPPAAASVRGAPWPTMRAAAMTAAAAKDLDIYRTLAGNRRATFSNVENTEICPVRRPRGPVLIFGLRICQCIRRREEQPAFIQRQITRRKSSGADAFQRHSGCSPGLELPARTAMQGARLGIVLFALLSRAGSSAAAPV